MNLEQAYKLAREQNAIYRRGIIATDELINNSEGVSELHLNGETATWDELRRGGRFEEWLHDFDCAADIFEIGGDLPENPRSRHHWQALLVAYSSLAISISALIHVLAGKYL